MNRWLLPCLMLLFFACGTDEENNTPLESLDIPPGGDIILPADVGPDDVDAAEPEPEVVEPPTPGLGLDYENLEPGVVPRYELEGEGWTAMPWPSDRARTEEGRPDLSILPSSESQLWQDYLAYADEVLDGFGLNSAIYFEFSGLLDLATLPDAYTTMTDPKAPIQLVNVTLDSPRYGQQLPVEFDLYEKGDDLYYLPNTLAVRPVFGYPMAEGETYCVLITRGITDAQGLHLSVSEDFQNTWQSEPSLAPLKDWLPESMLLEEDLAVGTCFTTSDATGDMRHIRSFLENEPLPTISEIAYMGTTNTFHEFEGEYIAPNFQQGEKPYEYTGGDFVFDEDGDPVIQLEEPVKFLLMLPTGFQMPEEGWPIVLYGHGTGGDHTTCKASVAPFLVLEAVAIVCIDLPLHGARGDPDWDVELLSFNFLNPRAGRTNFRQAAVDTMSLGRMVSFQGMDLDADTVPYGGNPEKFFDEDVRFDPAQVHYFGHSHGGLSGAIAFGVEPRIISGVLSGAGGGFTETVLRRKDIVDFAFIFTSLMKVDEDELDAFHPALTMLQTLVDATDPLNYSPYWLSPAPGGRAKHVFITCGTEDEATPYVTTTAMAAAGGIPMLEPVVYDDLAHELKGLTPEASPVTLNVVSSTGEPLTGALRQWDGWDHFVAFDHPEARAMWQSFFRGIRYGQSPIIGVN